MAVGRIDDLNARKAKAGGLGDRLDLAARADQRRHDQFAFGRRQGALQRRRVAGMDDARPHRRQRLRVKHEFIEQRAPLADGAIGEQGRCRGATR